MIATFEQVRETVIEWLDDNVHFGEAAALIKGDESSFLENGILDSLGFVRLVLFLEDRFGVRINRQHLTRENFDSLGRIARYVVSRTNGITA